MSDRAYFANTFHKLGNMTIGLNDALNLLVRSYRVNVPDNEIDEARNKLLSFLDIVLDVEDKSQKLWRQELRGAMKASIKKTGGLAKIESIRHELQSNAKLTQLEIDLLDTLISQASRQATIAFRKLRSAA